MQKIAKLFFLNGVVLAALLGYLQFHGYYYFPWLSGKFKSPADLLSSYDYIVVGSGSAGGIVASRLSEDPTKTVLLLEAGGEETAFWWTHIPSYVVSNQLTKLDWQYKTVPQNQTCKGLNEEQNRWPRGKVLGGSSVLNYMVYVRGHPDDFNRWSKELGCKKWSYKEVLPFFKKFENVEIKGLENTDVRGVNGPVAVTEHYGTEVGGAFLQAAKSMGYTLLDDYNGLSQDGFGRFQYNIDKWGRRQSTAKTFVRPAMKRKNLHVMINSLATKVLFNDQRKAIGVEYMYNGFRHTVAAKGSFANYMMFQNLMCDMCIIPKKEVILSGGAVNSPQLLMLSGIGPKDHLESLNIPVVFDNPAVGSNLLEHVMFSGMTWAINTTEGATNQRDNEFLRLLQYFTTATGRIITTGIEVTGFIHTGVKPKTDTPDVQILFFPQDPNEGIGHGYNLNPEVTRV